MGHATNPTLRVLSLGAGVQSTTMALMAAHGEIGPMPDCAIFADTQWEPQAVYDHLDWLMSPNVLPFPVHIVTGGNLREDIIAKTNTTGGRFASVPWHIRNRNGSAGMGRRQCTSEYKVRPVQRKIVDLQGGKRPKGGSEVWVGISTDEAMRVRPSRVQYIVNRHPLIECGMNRWDCRLWLQRNGYPEPPKSSCIGCPFHSHEIWREMKLFDLASWEDAVVLDHAIRTQSGIRGEQFMHRSLVPLDEADLSNAEDRGQIDLFNNDCEGMCGV